VATRGATPAPETEAYLALARASGRLQDELAVLVRGEGLSPAAYNVLRILRGARPEGLCCGEISERMVQRVPDVTRLVDRLEARGLVTRRRGETDRRVVFVTIREAGLALLAGLDAPVEALHRRQLGHLKKGELAELARLLARVDGRE